jgi:uncharacterized membrane protein
MVNILIIGIVLFGSLLGSIGVLMFKQEIDKKGIRKLATNIKAYSAATLLAISMALYLFALRNENLSIIYPLAATTYLWTTFFSVKYLHEKMNHWKYWGLLLIIIGVTIIGMGS